MPHPSDTIAAIATAPGHGAVGVLRLSGPAAFSIAREICGGALPEPRKVVLRGFVDEHGATVDRGLVLCFAAPNSFTGEDVVELQGHGGPAVLDLLLRSLIVRGARPARPGEFSERAFFNGRMDLAQAEGIADLVSASSAAAARAAARTLEGELSRRVQELFERLTQVRVYVEGALDFSDEDIDWLAAEAWRDQLARVCLDVDDLLARARRGRRLQEGLVIALTGAPNVGKSTLMNRLAGTDVAIVTEIAGTTRDCLRENLQLDGLPVTLVDTAGLRDSADPIEREGIRRARSVLGRAELALFLVDDREGFTDANRSLAASLPAGPRLMVIHNKSDLMSQPAAGRFEMDGRLHLRISAATGAGVEELIREIHDFAGLKGSTEGVFSARARHVEALCRTQAHAAKAMAYIEEGNVAEVIAEELALAQRALSEITGAFGAEELLGAIFRSFCIGK